LLLLFDLLWLQQTLASGADVLQRSLKNCLRFSLNRWAGVIDNPSLIAMWFCRAPPLPTDVISLLCLLGLFLMDKTLKGCAEVYAKIS